MKLITIADLIQYRLRNDSLVHRVAESRFSSRYGGEFRFRSHRPQDSGMVGGEKALMLGQATGVAGDLGAIAGDQRSRLKIPDQPMLSNRRITIHGCLLCVGSSGRRPEHLQGTGAGPLDLDGLHR